MRKQSNLKRFQQCNRKKTMKIMKKIQAFVVVYILKTSINGRSQGPKVMMILKHQLQPWNNNFLLITFKS